MVRQGTLAKLSDKRSETGGLHTTLKLAVGARVMLTANVDVSDGLVNGARGEVVHIAKNASDEIHKILVSFDNPSVGKCAIRSSAYRSNYGNAVPLSKHEATFLAMGKRGSEVTRVQFPLTLAWATTIHKVQGLTLDEIVVDLEGGNRFNPGQAYVAFSRVKTLQGLRLLNFHPSVIKTSSKVCEEMVRLSSVLIPKVCNLQCHKLCDTHVTFALLNVRCLLNKLPDIMHDVNLKCADVLCLCETWLSPQQDVPQLREGHVTIRSDRSTPNSRGGVLMSINQQFCPGDTLRFSQSGIEGLSTSIVIGSCRNVQLVLIYRSPKASNAMFADVLSRVLKSVAAQSDTPAIVMGDFNDPNMHSAISSVMCSNGFQLVLHRLADILIGICRIPGYLQFIDTGKNTCNIGINLYNF